MEIENFEITLIAKGGEKIKTDSRMREFISLVD